jgi:hypothetical protein
VDARLDAGSVAPSGGFDGLCWPVPRVLSACGGLHPGQQSVTPSGFLDEFSRCGEMLRMELGYEQGWAGYAGWMRK